MSYAGTYTTATIAFGFHIGRSHLLGTWPFINGDCWTGIKVFLPPSLRKEFLDAAQELGIVTNAPDDKWLLWRNWSELSATSVKGLHERLTGIDQNTQQQEIVDEMLQWQVDLERIVSETSGLVLK